MAGGAVTVVLLLGKKEVGTKGVFYPTGDVDKDIHTIREMYRGVTACHPENFVQV